MEQAAIIPYEASVSSLYLQAITLDLTYPEEYSEFDELKKEILDLKQMIADLKDYVEAHYTVSEG